MIFCREAPKAGSRPPITPVIVARKMPENMANGVVRSWNVISLNVTWFIVPV